MSRIITLVAACVLSLALLGVAQARTPSGYSQNAEIHSGEHHEQIPINDNHAGLYQCSQVSCTPAPGFASIAWLESRLNGLALRGLPDDGALPSTFAELDPPVPRPAG